MFGDGAELQIGAGLSREISEQGQKSRVPQSGTYGTKQGEVRPVCLSDDRITG